MVPECAVDQHIFKMVAGADDNEGENVSICTKCSLTVTWGDGQEPPEVMVMSLRNILAGPVSRKVSADIAEWKAKQDGSLRVIEEPMEVIDMTHDPERYDLKVVNRSPSQTEVHVDGKLVKGVTSVEYSHRVNEHPVIALEIASVPEGDTIIFNGSVPMMRDRTIARKRVTADHELVSASEPWCVCEGQEEGQSFADHIIHETYELLFPVSIPVPTPWDDELPF